MSEPIRVLQLVNTAVTALTTGGQPALDVVIRDLDDHDMETLITHMAECINVGTTTLGWSRA
ncbi:hypothetical protein AB0L57_32100 [Nocardia sp. NPDC052254]|uniref:hypothetical protein n=1 Tax=Nocardia sp. NPDC052254 TaxID=3155681 RepID=UPI003422A964